MSSNNSHSRDNFSTKPSSSTVARQQQNHSTQSAAAPGNGPRDDNSRENTYELFNGKTALQIAKEVLNRDDGHNFSFFTTTPEEYFGLPVKPKSTNGAAPSKGKDHKVEEKGGKSVTHPR